MQRIVRLWLSDTFRLRCGASCSSITASLECLIGLKGGVRVEEDKHILLFLGHTVLRMFNSYFIEGKKNSVYFPQTLLLLESHSLMCTTKKTLVKISLYCHRYIMSSLLAPPLVWIRNDTTDRSPTLAALKGLIAPNVRATWHMYLYLCFCIYIHVCNEKK